jgi:hypothetical protein
MLSTFVAVFPDWSLTWTVKVWVSTVVGVPVTEVDWTPKSVAIVSPAGMRPARSLNVWGVPWPPLHQEHDTANDGDQAPDEDLGDD